MWWLDHSNPYMSGAGFGTSSLSGANYSVVSRKPHKHTHTKKAITHLANIWHKQNFLWFRHKQLHLRIFLPRKSLAFWPWSSRPSSRNVWELWNYDCIRCVCLCIQVLCLSAGQGLFPPHRATGLSMFLGEHQAWPTCQILIYFFPCKCPLSDLKTHS